MLAHTSFALFGLRARRRGLIAARTADAVRGDPSARADGARGLKEGSRIGQYLAQQLQWQAVRRTRGLPHDAWAIACLQMQTLGRTSAPGDLSAEEMRRMLEAFALVTATELTTLAGEGRADCKDSATRRARLIEQCFATCDRRFNLARENSMAHREQQARYIEGAARKLFGRATADLDESQLQHLLMALTARAGRVCARAFRAQARHLARFASAPLRREDLQPCCVPSVRHATAERGDGKRI